MEKWTALLLALLMLSALAGCGQNSVGSGSQNTEPPPVAGELPAAEPETITTYPISEIYVPQTGIVNPPVVIQRLTASLPQTLNGPAVALMEIDDKLNILGENGQTISTAAEFMDTCSAAVIPAFIIDSQTECDTLAAYLNEHMIIDALTVADNTDADLLYQFRQSCKEVRGALIFDDLSEKESKKAALRLTNDSLANVIISRTPLSAEDVSYFNIRAVATWCCADDAAGVYQAIAAGWSGVISPDPAQVYDVYNDHHLKTISGQPLPIAHRGDRRYPENTLLAFEKAIEAGCLAVETDLRMSADREIVLLHDTSLSRTTDQDGVINFLTLEEIQAATCDDVPGYEEKIPTFKEALEAFGDTDLVFYCHINIRTMPLVEKFNELAAGYEDQVVFFIDYNQMERFNHSTVLDGISFVAADYKPILHEKDDLLTIEAFIRGLSPYNYQPLFYSYATGNHQREDFYYELAARGFVNSHSITNGQFNLNDRLITGQGAIGVLSDELEYAEDYAYQIIPRDVELTIGQVFAPRMEVIKTIGGEWMDCQLIQLSGPELTWSDSLSGYTAAEPGEATVVYSTRVHINSASYSILSSPARVTILPQS